MRQFLVKQLNYDLTPVAGLALVGHHLQRLAPVKECVGHTHAGVVGYCPMASYLGTKGIWLELALRPGVQHSVLETEYNFERVIPRRCRSTGVTGLPSDRAQDRQAGPALDRCERELEGWTTTLSAKQFSADDIIELYAGHGTHEQFHSEFKTDLDLERVPSGKFETNYLVCALAAVAMNILRLMGQDGLHGPDSPVRHPAKRRRRCRVPACSRGVGAAADSGRGEGRRARPYRGLAAAQLGSAQASARAEPGGSHRHHTK